jgi:nucleoside 2-deoxyribosyltransferase
MFNKIDLENDPDFQEYKKHIIEELIPKIDNTDVFVSIMPSGKDKVDVKFAVELGIAILLDKPIVAIMCPGDDVSNKFKQVVDRFIELDIKDPLNYPKITEALNGIMKEDWERNEHVNPDDIDVQFAIELGYIVMYDRPVIAAVASGTGVSRKFSQIIDRFVDIGNVNNLTQEEVLEAVNNHQGIMETAQEMIDEGIIYDPWLKEKE